MLQRSPTYVVSRPGEDAIANFLRRHLPAKAAYWLVRWKNVLLTMYFFRLARKRPAAVKQRLLGWVRDELGPDFDIETHFTPRYNPWDQRVCLVPDSDLFASLREGRASVVTDQIETFTENGLKLKSGQELEADIIVTATGLNLQVMNGLKLTVDGQRVDPSKVLAYKGMMYEGVPNLISFFGYTNASWTLKADLTADYVCRLLNHMQKTGMRQATPRNNDPDVEQRPWLDFSSGYVQRSIDKFPKQGDRAPWKLHQNYALDILLLRHSKIDDGVMEFSNPASQRAKRQREAVAA
jgi:cation diffusion facilitator CzcD-associated flavoprotein CzcO